MRQIILTATAFVLVLALYACNEGGDSSTTLTPTSTPTLSPTPTPTLSPTSTPIMSPTQTVQAQRKRLWAT